VDILTIRNKREKPRKNVNGLSESSVLSARKIKTEVTMRKIVAFFAVPFLLLAFFPGQGLAQKAEFTFKVHHFLPAGSNAQTKLIQPWADRITAESGGRIAVEIYPSMQLGGKPPQLYDQVRDGVVDVVWTLPGYTPGRFPISELFELPFMAASAEATTQALQEFSQTYLKEEFRHVHPLLFHVHAPGLFHMVSNQVKTMEDLKGLKVRGPTPSATQSLKALGATPVGMPVPEVPQALATQVIDGALIPWEVGKALRIHELTKYHTEAGGDRGVYTAVFLFAMNRKTYDSLPDDLKKIVDKNSGMNIAQEIGQAFDHAEIEGRELAKQKGNVFYTLPPEEVKRWKQATRPVVDAWLENIQKKGQNGKELLETAENLINKYSNPTTK
jgi:TRAP-type C4-dicarboxylate transport system substrate-binding protein